MGKWIFETTNPKIYSFRIRRLFYFGILDNSNVQFLSRDESSNTTTYSLQIDDEVENHDFDGQSIREYLLNPKSGCRPDRERNAASASPTSVLPSRTSPLLYTPPPASSPCPVGQQVFIKFESLTKTEPETVTECKSILREVVMPENIPTDMFQSLKPKYHIEGIRFRIFVKKGLPKDQKMSELSGLQEKVKTAFYSHSAIPIHLFLMGAVLNIKSSLQDVEAPSIEF